MCEMHADQPKPTKHVIKDSNGILLVFLNDIHFTIGIVKLLKDHFTKERMLLHSSNKFQPKHTNPFLHDSANVAQCAVCGGHLRLRPRSLVLSLYVFVQVFY